MSATVSDPQLSLGGPRHQFVIGEKEFLLDNEPFLIRSGEIHYQRIPREYWRHRLQMMKAMGLNTVCVYIFWNVHEWNRGSFDWSGQRDVRAFCRLAEKEGLWVLLRPGPYVCGEWDLGGLPWWLLKEEGIQLRSRDPKFIEPALGYLREVGRLLAPLQVTRGGPILMVQVENEYGMFADDTEYMRRMRQAYLDVGFFEVPLFACNPRIHIGKGFLPELFQIANFGPGIWPKGFPAIRQFQRSGPLMIGEYYPGWIDAWGKAHRTGETEPFVADLRKFLKERVSFNFYMAHGGTNFGLNAGGATPFEPFTTSYDYDAPITEAGWAGEKFGAVRELFAEHLQHGETLPEPPATNPVIAIPEFEFKETAPVFQNLPVPLHAETPWPMEFHDQGRGCVIYRTEVPAGPEGKLCLKALNDFGWVFLNGEKLDLVVDRRARSKEDEDLEIALPKRESPLMLDILVEAMGRANFFGPGEFDRKGLHGPVELDGEEMRGWKVFPLPLDQAQLASQRFGMGRTASPAFWRASFELERTGDTFLDLRTWGKGVAWINGRCLGRFWNIGPQQTLYCPGPWLKAGRNEMILLDLLGPRSCVVAGLEKPILNECRPEFDFSQMDLPATALTY